MAESAFGIQLAWAPSRDKDVAGYALYYGTNSGEYQTRIDVGSQTNATIQVPTNGATYFFMVTVYTVDDVESLPSNEVSYVPPGAGPPRPATDQARAMISMPVDDQGFFHFRAQSQAGMAFVVEASLDLQNWSPIYTNFFGGLIDYIDTRSQQFPLRFYRLKPLGPLPPKGSLLSRAPDGSFRFHLDGVPGVPYRVQASTNLIDWEDLFFNSAGGPLDYLDKESAKFPRRYYRAVLVDLNPRLSLTTATATDRFRVLINGQGSGPYVVQASADLRDWTDVYTSLYGLPTELGVGTLWGAPSVYYRTQPLSWQPTASAQFDPYYQVTQVDLDGSEGVPYVLQATYDLQEWTSLMTNFHGGAMTFYDWNNYGLPIRDYRAVSLNFAPVVTQLPPIGDGLFHVYAETLGAQPFVIQASSDLVKWSDLYTNAYGGPVEFADDASATEPQQFYRTRILPAQPDLTWPTDEPLVQFHLDGLSGLPYVIEFSTDQLNWLSVATNTAGGPLELVVTQDPNSPPCYYRLSYQTLGIRGSK